MSPVLPTVVLLRADCVQAGLAVSRVRVHVCAAVVVCICV